MPAAFSRVCAFFPLSKYKAQLFHRAASRKPVISCRGVPVPPADIFFFFSRMAARVRQQPVTDQDVLAVEEQANFCLARDSVLSSLQVCHPIVVEQYDICALVKSKAVKKLKVALLQVLCESLELQVPSPQVRRKAPYLALLQNLVNSSSCSAIIVWTHGAFLLG